MNKRKILTMAMALCMVAILAVGGTLAYFTDTDSAKNVFTTGNVEIDLTEVKVDDNENGDLVPVDKAGNFVEDIKAGDRQDVGDDAEDGDDTYDYGKVYPGQYIVKDPTIENLGSEDVYMAAIVTIKSAGNLYSVIGTPNSPYLNTTHKVQLSAESEPVQVISGQLADEEAVWVDAWNGTDAFVGETYTVVQKAIKSSATESEYVLYFFINDYKKTGEKVTLFEQINFHYLWDNEQMAAFKDLSINVDAYAVQAYGFYDDDCYTAITTAFPEAFAAVK